METQNIRKTTPAMLELAQELSIEYNIEMPKDIEKDFKLCKKFLNDCIKQKPPTDAQMSLANCLAASKNIALPAECFKYAIACDNFIKKCKKGLIKDPYEVKIDKAIKSIENYITKNKELIEKLKITKQDISFLYQNIQEIIFENTNSKQINKIIKNNENEIILLMISSIKKGLKPINKD